MVPIYACESFLGMVFYRESAGINVLRSCYESVVLYSFYQFLIVALGGQRNLADMLAYKPPVRHTFPLQWVAPWTMGNTFLKLCTIGILQCVTNTPAHAPCDSTCLPACSSSASSSSY